MDVQILRDFLNVLVRIRISDPELSDEARHAYEWHVSHALGFLVGLRSACAIDAVSHAALEELIWGACAHRGDPFPRHLNAGPCIYPWDLRERNEQAQEVVHVAPVEVSASTASCGVRLLCLLVPTRTGDSRSLPVHTMHRMPPYARLSGRYHDGAGVGQVALDPLNVPSGGGFYLREAHARPASAAVLARCVRQWQTHAFRTDPRALRSGGLNHAH